MLRQRSCRLQCEKGASAAYFPACVNRIFGRDVSSPKTSSLPEVPEMLGSDICSKRENAPPAVRAGVLTALRVF